MERQWCNVSVARGNAVRRGNRRFSWPARARAHQRCIFDGVGSWWALVQSLHVMI